MATFKPMLADHAELDKLRYPVLTSPKLDGVRATFVNGKLLTRSLKPLANPLVNTVFQSEAPLDGELIVGDPDSPSVFRDTMKVVSSHTAPIQGLRFFVFDVVTAEKFVDRYQRMQQFLGDDARYIPVTQVLVENETELLNLEEATLESGYEGLMIRDPNAGYKFWRSTVSEGALLKLKRFLQSEAMVVGFVEQMHNANEAKISNLGYTERSSHQANLIPTGVLGALVVRDLTSGVEFNVGTGFTAADRGEIWRRRHEYIGSRMTYKYLPVGVKDKPRHPVFLGWRPEGT